MMMADRIEDLRGNAGVALQYVISGRGMGFDQRTLLGIEAARLVKNRERNLCLADVVKYRRRLQSLEDLVSRNRGSTRNPRLFR